MISYIILGHLDDYIENIGIKYGIIKSNIWKECSMDFYTLAYVESQAVIGQTWGFIIIVLFC